MKHDIVLIDSGVNADHIIFKNKTINGLNLLNTTDYVCDNIGHGTAVYYLLQKYAPEADIFVVKIFDNEFSTSYDNLVQALEYIYDNIECKIIHLSNGITYCEDIEYLKGLCHKFIEKGTFIVSGFDNGGALSYPAAFEDVIGVDWSPSCKRLSDYEYLENSIVNIRGIGTELRVPWLKNDYILVGGSSFAAPYISSLVFKHLTKGIVSLTDIKKALKQEAKKVIQFQEADEIDRCFDIERGLVFPFNKEIHSLLRYEKLLIFSIEKLCDFRFLGNVGKKVSEITDGAINSDTVIEDIDKLDWNNSNFDCFILGHTNEISQILKRDIILEIIEKCIIHSKNLYCFDDLSQYKASCDKLKGKGLKVYYPNIEKKHVPKNNCGKLRHIGKPTIGVFGTSSRQGKFTVQMFLRERFMEDGYQVGQLGTEPSAALFGCDICYPVGYASTVKVSGLEAITIINHLMGKIEASNPDIIILGGQSQTIPYSTGNIGLYTLYNQELLLGCEPDVCILCINAYDEVNYIVKTIQFIKSWLDTEVISLVMFPMERNLRWSVFGNQSILIPKEILMEKRKKAEEVTQLPVYLLNERLEMEQLYQKCLAYFAE